jgi:hypothetical protein
MVKAIGHLSGIQMLLMLGSARVLHRKYCIDQPVRVRAGLTVLPVTVNTVALF